MSTKTWRITLARRADERVRAWRVVEERRMETERALLVFGRRDNEPVVVKLIKDGADEWRSGAVSAAFHGLGVVRVYEYAGGAMLLEQLRPGVPLAFHASGQTDVEATAILAGVIASMKPRMPDTAVPRVEDWLDGFERYARSGDRRIPGDLVAEARRTYDRLCASQTSTRLLHGDLHHYNVLFDAGQGWVAIDPKGVIGEMEYEVAAALRNPYDRPELFTRPAIVRDRIDTFSRNLHLDPMRVVLWAFAQAVLSAIWSLEDGCPVQPGDARLTLADTLRQMARASGHTLPF